MTGIATLAARGALGGVAALCSLALIRGKRFLQATQQSFDRGILAALAASRLGLYALVFFGLHLPARGDVPFFYRSEALAVLHGFLPYRDFSSSYAPLHGFLDAGVLRLWDSPLALILFATLIELLAFPLFLKAARHGFEESRVRLAALLYLASPVSLQFVTIDGQDNILIALLLAAAVLCLVQERPAASGALLGAAIVLVKFLPLLFVPLLLFACRRRWRWLLGFGGVLVAGYAPFALLHAPLLCPLYAEGQVKTASDLPFLFESLLGIDLPGRLSDGVLLCVLLGLLALFWSALRRAEGALRLRLVFAGCAAMTLALLLLSKKSWPPYLMLVWFPICLLPVRDGFRRFQAVAFVLFSWVAILAHSMWATVFLQVLGPDLHASSRLGEPVVLLFLVLQCLLICGYGWLLTVAIRGVGRFSAMGLPGHAALLGFVDREKVRTFMACPRQDERQTRSSLR